MIEKWFEPFTLLERQSTPDGLGGEIAETGAHMGKRRGHRTSSS